MPAASHRLIRPLLAAAAVLVALAPAPAPAGASAPAAGCASPLLDRATRGSEVRATSADDLAAAARVNDVTVRDLAAQVGRDRTLWLDVCGQAFNVEPADREQPASAGTADASATTTDPGPLSSALLLESNPGAARTIYLDFTGATVTGTAWNTTYGTATMTVAPYSVTAPADTAFTLEELAEIQKAWQVVAEDYAPFDVNVTTKPPAAGAIERSGPGDTTYGTRVLVTSGGTIYDSCLCGGVAYVGVFDLTQNHEFYQPAWVFTQGTSTSGRRLGEAASHEAGHTLGLGHDGTSSSAYYAGSPPWAPIMGSSYNQPVTQWSAGEYPGATNTEDDVALIAAQLGILADDHADTVDGATALGTTPLDGVITTRADTDAFTFSGAGETTLTATPGPGYPDLDLGLRILDSSGTLIASIDPPVARVGPSSATGLGATWTATLPDTPATYTAIVDGVGSGDPGTPGKYSDYASLGHYRITLGAVVPGPALALTPTTPPQGTVGIAYSAVPAIASGGAAPYSWAAAGLPPGLTINPDSAAVTGTPTSSGSFTVTLTVADAAGALVTTTFVLAIGPAPVTEPPPSGVTPALVPVDATPFAFVTRAHLPAGRIQRRYRTRITTLGADGALTWRRSGRLPRGLRFVRRASGAVAVSGRPAEAGRYVLRLTATDSSGARVVRRFILRIRR